MRFPILLLCTTALFAQARYDLLLKGGHVIDPKNRISEVRDVAIRDGAIAAVARDIPPAQARKGVGVAGLYVTPGLVDLHAHVFAGSDGVGLAGGHSSTFPDDFALRVGVTTVVDAGSSGRRNFAQFKRTVIDRARTRVLAFLNVLGAGMPAPKKNRTSATWRRSRPRRRLSPIAPPSLEIRWHTTRDPIGRRLSAASKPARSPTFR